MTCVNVYAVCDVRRNKESVPTIQRRHRAPVYPANPGGVVSLQGLTAEHILYRENTFYTTLQTLAASSLSKV